MFGFFYFIWNISTEIISTIHYNITNEKNKNLNRDLSKQYYTDGKGRIRESKTRRHIFIHTYDSNTGHYVDKYADTGEIIRDYTTEREKEKDKLKQHKYDLRNKLNQEAYEAALKNNSDVFTYITTIKYTFDDYLNDNKSMVGILSKEIMLRNYNRDYPYKETGKAITVMTKNLLPVKSIYGEYADYKTGLIVTKKSPQQIYFIVNHNRDIIKSKEIQSQMNLTEEELLNYAINIGAILKY